VENGVQHLSQQKTNRAARATVWHDPFLEALEYRGSRDAIVRWRKSKSQPRVKAAGFERFLLVGDAGHFGRDWKVSLMIAAMQSASIALQARSGLDRPQQMYCHAESLLRNLLHSHYLGKIFGLHRVVCEREGVSHEQSHTLSIVLKRRIKIHSAFRNVCADRKFFKMLKVAL
jgi:hypothetical protein